MIKQRDTVGSPLSNETVVRGDLAGRATAADIQMLRADFAARLSEILLDDEAIQRLVAVRATGSGRQSQRERVIALTLRAVIHLHASEGDPGSGYGVRAIIVPLERLTAVELSQRFLRGVFIVHAGGTPLVEVAYHALDEALFTGMVRAIRAAASSAPC